MPVLSATAAARSPLFMVFLLYLTPLRPASLYPRLSGLQPIAKTDKGLIATKKAAPAGRPVVFPLRRSVRNHARPGLVLGHGRLRRVRLGLRPFDGARLPRQAVDEHLVHAADRDDVEAALHVVGDFRQVLGVVLRDEH